MQSLANDAVMFLSISVTKGAITLEEAKKCLTTVSEVSHSQELDFGAAADTANELDQYNRQEFRRIYGV